MQQELIRIEGWKGKGDLYIGELIDKFKIIEKRKNKETGQVYEDEHLIPKDNVFKLWDMIKKNCDLQTEYKYKYLVRLILEHYGLHKEEECPLNIMMEAFNGGSNRAKYYFPYLYYPLKVLEAKKMISYFGRGGIQRLE